MKSVKATLAACAFTLAGSAIAVLAIKVYHPHWLMPAAAPAGQTLVSTDAPLPAVTLPALTPAPENSTQAMTPPPVIIQPPATPPNNPFRRNLVTDDMLGRNNLAKVLKDCRTKLTAYQSQHDGALPNFQSYPGWKQLTFKTRVDGSPVSGGPRGPYMNDAPINPLNGNGAVGLVRHDVIAGQIMPGQGLGFVFNISNGKLWGTDADGRTIFDESSAPADR